MLMAWCRAGSKGSPAGSMASIWNLRSASRKLLSVSSTPSANGLAAPRLSSAGRLQRIAPDCRPPAGARCTEALEGKFARLLDVLLRTALDVLRLSLRTQRPSSSLACARARRLKGPSTWHHREPRQSPRNISSVASTRAPLSALRAPGAPRLRRPEAAGIPVSFAAPAPVVVPPLVPFFVLSQLSSATSLLAVDQDSAWAPARDLPLLTAYGANVEDSRAVRRTVASAEVPRNATGRGAPLLAQGGTQHPRCDIDNGDHAIVGHARWADDAEHTQGCCAPSP
jgi:hypothetical protein